VFVRDELYVTLLPMHCHLVITWILQAFVTVALYLFMDEMEISQRLRGNFLNSGQFLCSQLLSSQFILILPTYGAILKDLFDKIARFRDLERMRDGGLWLLGLLEMLRVWTFGNVMVLSTLNTGMTEYLMVCSYCILRWFGHILSLRQLFHAGVGYVSARKCGSDVEK